MDDRGGRNNNNRGRGRGRGGGRGRQQGGDGGGGSGLNRPPVQNAWSNRPPVQNEPSNRPPVQNAWSGRPPTQNEPSNRPPVQNAWSNRPPVQNEPSNRPPVQNAWSNRPPVQNAWANRTPVQQRPPSADTDHNSPRGQQQPISQPTQQSIDELSVSTLRISEDKPLSASSPGSNQDQILQPLRRPDQGGILATRTIKLLVNHFPVKFNPNTSIIHYDIAVKPLASKGTKFANKPPKKSELRVIKDKFIADNPRFLGMTGYDGEKNIYSAVPLPQGKFTVTIPEGEEAKSGSYELTIKFVNELRLSKLLDYMKGNLPYVPRDVLQSMDVVMKENPARHRIFVGGSFYSPQYEADLSGGVAAYKGFNQSLKPTSRGLALCLDYSILSLRKPLPVIDYLKEHVPRFEGVGDVKRLKREVNNALRGLKVRVTHRLTKQKYTIRGLANRDARESSFDLVDPDGQNPPRRIGLVQYFKEKWGRDLMYPDIPCLELGKNDRSNEVPMEFCIVVEGQRYPKEDLDKDSALFLKNMTLAKPWDRRKAINELVQASDGPCGTETKNFGIGIDARMTQVVGRVISAPELKLGSPTCVRVDADKRQWNLLQKSFVEGKSMERWALLDFTQGDRFRLQGDAFISGLIGRCKKLGMHVERPVVLRQARMNDLASVNILEKLMKGMVDEGYTKCGAKLQMIVCVMTRKDPGYKSLKWISETKIGVITQCCLSMQANKAQDQYLANLCLKINAKLGGSNFELLHKLPHFDSKDHVMFIGADVNHPGRADSLCPSIAAVVGTVNWPGANRYAARVGPQAHRKEQIMNFGSMCMDLVNTYELHNKVKPRKIIVFRDGVSEGQFEMVLSQEMLDLKRTFHDNHYEPLITLVTVQKRHRTRLFVENRNDGGMSGNVPPGTVVDKDIVHPVDFDFYLCSHYGSLGTSKAAHYYVLWDENSFTSDELQKLIYDLCFTFVRCTKPVSLVTPVYYADLVAYRGRMFQEVVMDAQSSQSRGSSCASSSSLSSSSSTPSNVSFNQSFYKVHPDLENYMFFV